MGFGIIAVLTAAVVGAIVVIVGIVAVFFYATIGALMGAVTGLILHYVPVLGPLVENGLSQIGIQNPDLTSIGAALGFIAGFFKSAQEQKRDH
ncbi:MAG: hypothetical protein ABIF01_00950 [Candidatus Micrarchaeota archaeon]